MIKNNSLNREEWDDRLFAFWQNEPLDEKEGEDIRYWLQENESHCCHYRQLQKSYLRQCWIILGNFIDLIQKLFPNGFLDTASFCH